MINQDVEENTFIFFYLKSEGATEIHSVVWEGKRKLAETYLRSPHSELMGYVSFNLSLRRALVLQGNEMKPEGSWNFLPKSHVWKGERSGHRISEMVVKDILTAVHANLYELYPLETALNLSFICVLYHSSSKPC